MSNAPFKHTLSPDKTIITIDAGAAQPLDAEKLEIVMEWLGQVRSEMSPAVPDQPTPTTRPRPITTWHVQALGASSAAKMGAQIAFRSAQFGWFTLRLSPDDCRHFGQDLLGGDNLPIQ